MTDSSNSQSPGDAARAFLAALNDRRWDDAGAMVHPETAARHQQMELAILMELGDRQVGGRPMGGLFSVSSAIVHDEEMVRRVGPVAIPGYRGGATIAGLLALTPAEFMARTLENALGGGLGSTAGARLGDAGEVVEGDTVDHAIYRAAPVPGGTSPDDAYEVSTLDLWRLDGRWYVVPDQMLLRMGSMAIVLVREHLPSEPG